MRRRAFALWLLVGAAGCADGDGLRERIEASGVFSPGRTDGGRQEVLDLGQLLFFERALSGNRNIACSSCHMPVHHASEELALGRGQGATETGAARRGGPLLPRNTVAPFNRSFAHTLLWDGRIERLDDGSIRSPVPLPEGIETLLEAQALLPLLDREEMRGEIGDRDALGAPNELSAMADDATVEVWDAIVTRLMAFPEYRERFAAAFPEVPAGEHGIVHVARALARFEMRLWELTDTPFDQFLGAEHRAPVDEVLQGWQRQGAELFFGDAGCYRCHGGPLLSDDAFHNIGAPPFGPGKRDGLDEGRFLVTGDPADRFAFRTPPLRNVALTAPYLHNGVASTLDEAIRQHVRPEAALDDGFVDPLGSSVTVEPALADAIRATIDPDTRPLRPLTDEELWMLSDFLQSLSSQTELGVFPGAGEPLAVPSGLPVDRSGM